MMKKQLHSLLVAIHLVRHMGPQIHISMLAQSQRALLSKRWVLAGRTHSEVEMAHRLFQVV